MTVAEEILHRLSIRICRFRRISRYICRFTVKVIYIIRVARALNSHTCPIPFIGIIELNLIRFQVCCIPERCKVLIVLAIDLHIPISTSIYRLFDFIVQCSL